MKMAEPIRSWKFLLMLFFGAVISYLNRAALPLVAADLQTDLGFDSIQMGYVYGSFFVGYSAFNYIGGRAADRWGPYSVCAASVAAWSFCSYATAGSHGFFMVIVSRLLLGASEGPFGAAGVKLLSNHFRKHEAASAIGTFSSGTPLGGAIAGPFIGYFVATFNWRSALAASASLGLLWLIAWAVILLRDRIASFRADAPTGTIQHRVPSNDDPGKLDHPTADLTRHLFKPLILATAIGFFGYSYLLFFFLTWFPAYLGMAHHLTVRLAGLQTSIAWLLGFIGLLLGGRISDAIFRATGDAVFSRKIVIVIGLAIAAICAATATHISGTPGTVAVMSISIFCLYLTGALYWTLVQDNVPSEVLGSVSGFVHTISNAAGFIGPIVTGYIVAKQGSYEIAFRLAGALAAVGAVVVGCFVRESSTDAR